MDINIREAISSDVPQLAELIRSLGYFTHITSELPHLTEERLLKHLSICDANECHLVLVAETPGGGIIGYGAVHWLPYFILPGPEGYVSELFIRKPFRGQGVGRRILDVIVDEARRRGCSRLMLLNMRKRESYERRFYAKQGWEERPDAANFVLTLTK